MNYSYKKYVVLAILGSLIIGIAVYLFLNSYLEKIGIIVLKENISEGEIIKESNITTGYYLKNSLPEGYLKDKAEAIGKPINTNRFKGDYLTEDMFKKEKEEDLFKNLNPDEALISINIDLKEKITEELKVDYMIMLVAIEKNKELEDLFYKKNFNTNNSSFKEDNIIKENDLNVSDYDLSSSSGEFNNSRNYLETSTFEISENVSLIDGYLIIKNIEVLQIKNFQDKNNSLISNSGNNLTTIYLKCKINEAPYIAGLASSGKYKIIIGNNQKPKS
jgi:hypothetical protein